MKAQQKGLQDISKELTTFDVQQKKVLQAFRTKEFITAYDIAMLLKLKPRTARALCQKWVESGFLSIVDPSKKNRTYSFSKNIKKLL